VVEMRSQLELYRTLLPMLERLSSHARVLGAGDAARAASGERAA
jgi:hypothetical protein